MMANGLDVASSSSAAGRWWLSTRCLRPHPSHLTGGDDGFFSTYSLKKPARDERREIKMSGKLPVNERHGYGAATAGIQKNYRPSQGRQNGGHFTKYSPSSGRATSKDSID